MTRAIRGDSLYEAPMPKLPDMSQAAVLRRAQMERTPMPAPAAAEAPKIRIAQSRIGPTRKKKKKAA